MNSRCSGEGGGRGKVEEEEKRRGRLPSVGVSTIMRRFDRCLRKR
jgi:hypothetical protein